MLQPRAVAWSAAPQLLMTANRCAAPRSVQLLCCRLSSGSSPSPSPGPAAASAGGYSLVYRGPKNRLVTAVKAFSLTTSAVGIGAQAFVLSAGRGGAPDVVLIGGLGLFALATPLLLHLFTSSYVFWLYAMPNQAAYRAVTKSMLLRNRCVDFRADQVSLTETGIPFANLCVADGRKLFVDPAYSVDFESVAKLFEAGRNGPK